jgi:hypothetical protein
MRARAQTITATSPPVVVSEPKIVEVPFIQEKVITRVVYIEKKTRRSARGMDQSAAPGGNSSVARAGSNTVIGTALNLTGFKPTDEVKLTIIKGTDKDQER